jgi:hypothetical protein
VNSKNLGRSGRRLVGSRNSARSGSRGWRQGWPLGSTLVQTLARMTQNEQDTIQRLLEATERAERSARSCEAEGSVGVVARLASSVEIKPRLFVSASTAKAILRDIHE